LRLASASRSKPASHDDVVMKRDGQSNFRVNLTARGMAARASRPRSRAAGYAGRCLLSHSRKDLSKSDGRKGGRHEPQATCNHRCRRRWVCSRRSGGIDARIRKAGTASGPHPTRAAPQPTLVLDQLSYRNRLCESGR
jgi:hypothetical protein